METITEECTGCRACEYRCPQKCISLRPDTEGFLTAKIKQDLCIDCGVCVKTCPQNNQPEKHTSIECWGFRNKNKDELFKSASGGAFVALANQVLANNGVVFGAAYISPDTVTHIIVDNKKELYRLQSSKYVQSDTIDSYVLVESELKKGRTVLFSGVPCQVSGLRNYLRTEYTNLITVDIICHGVPSPLLFKKYIAWLESKYGEHIESFDFRDKSDGWGLQYLAKTKTKTKTKSALLDPFYYHFLKGSIYRECCYRCKYATPKRVSDLTLGDYWGIKKEHPEFDSIEGVSCVLINTDKGREIFNQIQNSGYIISTTFEKIAAHNKNLVEPTHRPPIRDAIYNDINSSSPEEIVTRNLSFSIPIRRRIYSLLPTWLKRIIF